MRLRNCDMDSFSHYTQNKNIVCYGIGGEFERMIQAYSNYPWINKIKMLVDTNTARVGDFVKINENLYQIQSLEYMIQHITDDTVVLISCMSFYEVVMQLNTVHNLDNIECFLFHFMFPLSENRILNIKTTDQMFIPPVIHYCWFGKKKMPDLYKNCIDSWHKLCPNYEIVEWNEDNCDIDEIPFTRQAYDAGKYGFVPDYFRLKIIYEHGGIYLDTDVEILKNIDNLRYNHAFCGLEFPGEAALGLGFGAEKGIQLIYKLMQRYKVMNFINEDGSINEIGSPVFQSMDLRNEGMTSENKLQIVDKMTIFPIEVLSPQNVYTGQTEITPNTYMWHHFDASWVSGQRLEAKRKRYLEANKLHQLMNMYEET